MLNGPNPQPTNLPGLITVQPCHRGFVVSQYNTLLAVSTVDDLAGLVADLVQNPRAAAEYAEGPYLGPPPVNVVPMIRYKTEPGDWITADPDLEAPSEAPSKEGPDPEMVEAREHQNIRFLARQVMNQSMSLAEMMEEKPRFFPNTPTDTVTAILSEVESEMFQTEQA